MVDHRESVKGIGMKGMREEGKNWGSKEVRK
jgi:hypothetical protein